MLKFLTQWYESLPESVRKRIGNPTYWGVIAVNFILGAFAFSGVSINDFDTFPKLFAFIGHTMSSPAAITYIISSIVGFSFDPTTPGLRDTIKKLGAVKKETK